MAKYWIAQYVQDLFKNEPKNVAVFVQSTDGNAARYVGVDSIEEKLDRRKVRNRFKYSEVYEQWVEYWQSLVEIGDYELLMKSSSGHYRIIEAGTVTGVGQDTCVEIADNLFTSLVSDDYSVAMASYEVSAPTVRLEQEISNLIREMNLHQNVKHPVNRKINIPGKVATHQPAFSQENGVLYVMEAIDFSVSQKSRPKERSGAAAYMYRDIRDVSQSAEAISVVRYNEEDELASEVRYGLKVLRNESDVVNWNDQDQRSAYLESRRKVAVSVH